MARGTAVAASSDTAQRGQPVARAESRKPVDGAAASSDAIDDTRSEARSRSPRSNAAPTAAAMRATGGDNDRRIASAAGSSRRTDIRQDAIETLRAQHRQLREATKIARRDVRNASRRRKRVIGRLRNLDTASVLAVLMDRGLAPNAAAQPPGDAGRTVHAAPACAIEQGGDAAAAARGETPVAADSPPHAETSESEHEAERPASVGDPEAAADEVDADKS